MGMNLQKAMEQKKKFEIWIVTEIENYMKEHGIQKNKLNNEGIVKEVYGNNLYKIKILNKYYNIYCPSEATLKVNDIALIGYYNGDESRKYIIGKKPSNW